MHVAHLFRSLTIVICLAALPHVSFADDSDKSEKPTPQRIREALVKQASAYVIKVVDKKTALKLHDRSLLNWNNPLRTTEVGVVHVWIDEGMPMVIASLFTYEYKQTRLKHEFISLTDEPVTAKYGDRVAWTPSKPGVAWRALPAAAVEGAGQPVKSKVRRLVQMRRIASRFDFQVTSREKEVRKLRLMTQPLYRFESPKHHAVDGAIFAYSIATDPEVLVMLKANEKDTWEYAIVRSTNLGLAGTIASRQQWSAEAIPDLDGSAFGEAPFINYPYTSFHPTADFTFEIK